VVAHHERHAGLAHGARDFFRLRQAEGQRLLDEQRLARGQQLEHGVAVAAGGEEEDRLHVLLAGQLPAVLEPGAHPVPFAHGVDRPLAEVGQGDDLEEVRPLGQSREVHHLRDAAATDDTYTQRLAHGSISCVGIAIELGGAAPHPPDPPAASPK
jgi:hypothetical protein